GSTNRPNTSWPQHPRYEAKSTTSTVRTERSQRRNYLLRTPNPATHNQTPHSLRSSTGRTAMLRGQSPIRYVAQTNHTNIANITRQNKTRPSPPRHETKFPTATTGIEQPQRKNCLLRTPSLAVRLQTPRKTQHTVDQAAKSPGRYPHGRNEPMNSAHAPIPHPPIPSRQSTLLQQHTIMPQIMTTPSAVPFLWDAASCGPPLLAREGHAVALYHLTRFLDMAQLIPTNISQAFRRFL
ncbi:unnamed protein product, partial [Dicrocoelium dendriticum]